MEQGAGVAIAQLVDPVDAADEDQEDGEDEEPEVNLETRLWRPHGGLVVAEMEVAGDKDEHDQSEDLKREAG